ncbi:flagellar protein G [Natronomonas sp. LN261]|uniref:flagellar protein G n=1 Tax=Natronomonas sp. LN261 TaxID=2750669 RepID=UPI0015EFD7D5|nr:flagellar protein G [Natronomonas sp. LN261]
MSGVSASTLVIFIASILVAAGVAGTLVATVGDISNSAETKGDAITESIDADFEILNDGGGSKFYTEPGTPTAQITFYVRNTGSAALSSETDDIDVLVNGQYVVSSDLTIGSENDADDGVWAEGEVLQIIIERTDTLSGSGNRLTISAKGTERSLEFAAET